MPKELTKSGALKLIDLAKDSGILYDGSKRAAVGAVLCEAINDKQRQEVLKAILTEVMKGDN